MNNPRLFAVTAFGSNSEKAGRETSNQIFSGINAGAMEKARLYKQAQISLNNLFFSFRECLLLQKIKYLIYYLHFKKNILLLHSEKRHVS
jgi:hypothetical protein